MILMDYTYMNQKADINVEVVLDADTTMERTHQELKEMMKDLEFVLEAVEYRHPTRDHLNQLIENKGYGFYVKDVEMKLKGDRYERD